MQVMPATARDPGFNLRPADPNDPEDMNRLGREYRAVMERRYDGDLSKMWAAYNWGPGNLDNAIATHGDNWLDHAPAETRSYVMRNIAAAGASTGTGFDNAPREWDRAAVTDALEQRALEQGWTPERTERTRSELERRMTRDESLYQEVQADADEAAAEVILAQGENFTSTNMIPHDVWARMSVTKRATAEEVAERNNQPTAPVANSNAAINLAQMRYLEPDRFMRLDLSQYVGSITRAELDQVAQQQARMLSNRDGWTPDAEIVSAVNYGQRMNPSLDLKPQDEAIVMRIMEEGANRLYQQNGRVTDQQYAELFSNAVRQRTVTRRGWLWDSEVTVPRYQMQVSDIPESRVNRLESELRRQGLPVTDENVMRLHHASEGMAGNPRSGR